MARAAGVSVATASRAVSGKSNVSPEARTRVLAAAGELRYRASPAAVSLVTGRLRSVAVLMPFAGRWYFSEALQGIERGLQERGHDLVLYVLADRRRREEFFKSLPLRGRVDAVIVVALALDEFEVAALRTLQVPLAAVSEPIPGVQCNTIDNEALARLAVQHLVNLGHRRLACIGGEPGDVGWFCVPATRTAGYRAALQDNGIAIKERWIVSGGYTPEGGERAMAELLSLPGGMPTAVFCQSDEMAIGALASIRRAGLRCPEDVSIVGVDDHDLARYVQLTTVAQPVAEQAEAAARTVVDVVEGNPPGGTVPPAIGPRVHPVHLVIRGTTCQVAGRSPASPRSRPDRPRSLTQTSSRSGGDRGA